MAEPAFLAPATPILAPILLLAAIDVLNRENLEIANPLKAHLKHVEVVVVVFDV